MSSVSERMRQRRLVSGAPGTAAMTLADLDRGQRAIVLGYSDAVAPSTARRLFDLGLVPGVEVTMIRRAPLGDPVIFGVGDYEIALRGAQSDCITAKPAG
jgi:ferrous iron transport protein A